MVGAGVRRSPRHRQVKGELIGVVSEAESHADAPSWHDGPADRRLSRFLASDAAAAHQFVQSHSRRMAEVMTKEVVTAAEDTPLGKLAELMETHGVKRIPIVRDGKCWAS